ncbi:MAG: DUF2461 domain-containing protein [Marinilabiliaceae bacterium]|nr:DUF2461 domain-containing protein [Marinilabiliaceae bacterium]
MNEIINFLKELEQNNNREWFNSNKDRYLNVKSMFEDFIEQVIQGLATFDKDLSIVSTKESIFRIHRDTRFSHDKTPYKTHLGAFMAKGGKTNPRGGYYVHIQPNNSLLSGGIWCPTPAILKSLRQEIYNNADEFLSIVENPDLTHYYQHDDEKLKKVPPTFPSDSPVSEWLKNKRFTPVCYVPEQIFSSSDAVQQTVERLKLLYPLNSFINYSLSL